MPTYEDTPDGARMRVLDASIGSLACAHFLTPYGHDAAQRAREASEYLAALRSSLLVWLEKVEVAQQKVSAVVARIEQMEAA